MYLAALLGPLGQQSISLYHVVGRTCNFRVQRQMAAFTLPLTPNRKNKVKTPYGKIVYTWIATLSFCSIFVHEVRRAYVYVSL